MGEKTHHYIFFFVILSFLLALVIYMVIRFKKLSYQLLNNVRDNITEIISEQLRDQEPEIENNYFFQTFIYYLMSVVLIFSVDVFASFILNGHRFETVKGKITQVLTNDINKLIYLLGAVAMAIVSLILDSLTVSQRNFVIVYLMGTVSVLTVSILTRISL